MSSGCLPVPIRQKSGRLRCRWTVPKSLRRCSRVGLWIQQKSFDFSFYQLFPKFRTQPDNNEPYQ